MMKCSKCGQPIQEGQAFCKYCGNPIVVQKKNVERTDVNVTQQQQSENRNVNVQTPGGFSNTMQQPVPMKKKSYGPIIAIIIILVLVIFAAGGYFGFTIYKQAQIKERYKEVKTVIENGVELNDTHREDFEDLKDAQSSLNVFRIIAMEDTADDLIDFSKVYNEGNKNFEDYSEKLDDLNFDATAAGIDTASSENAKTISNKLTELKEALKDNNTQKIKTLSEEIPKELDKYEATIKGAVEANKVQAQKNAALMKKKLKKAAKIGKKYRKRFSKAVKKAKKKKIHKNSSVRRAKKAAKKALNGYSKAVRTKNLKKINKMGTVLRKKIKAYEKIVKKTKVKKKSSWSGRILPGVYSADGEEFVLADSSYLPYTSSGDPFMYHSNLYDTDRYCLSILSLNEVFARHGAHFETKSLREYFKTKSWYQDKGISTDQVRKKLSKTEKNNINVFAGWRDYYKDYVSGATGNASDFTAADYDASVRYFQRRYD